MNHEMIDHQLIELLRVPATLRRTEHVRAALASIAAAAQVEAVATTPLQHEQLKLLAIVEYLSHEFKTDIHNVSLELAVDPRLSLLRVWMLQLDGSAWTGRGNTAEQALRDLHKVEDREAAA